MTLNVSYTVDTIGHHIYHQTSHVSFTQKNTRSGEHIVDTLSQHNSRHLDDDLSNVLLALEVCVSLLGLLEWEHLVNEGLDLVSGDELVHVLESKLHKKREHHY